MSDWKPIVHTTTWAPTEGAKRADWLMREIQASAAVMGIQLAITAFPIFHQRVFNLIAEELDHALVGRAEQQEALDKVVGNGLGHGPIELDQGLWVPVGNGHADPVVEAHEEGPGAYSDLKYHGAPVELDRVGSDVNAEATTRLDPEPKKKRGRPKGSVGKPKAKKAKPAKAKKDAKEHLAEATEQLAPTMEALAAGDNQAEAVDAATAQT